MKHRWALLPLALALTLVATLGLASPSFAYEANSWYPHPALTSAWHCGPTENGTVLSAQPCVIVTSTSWQSVVLVRNRLKNASRGAEAWLEVASNEEADADYYCKPSALAANDYSGCFGYTVTESTAGLGFSVQATVQDTANGENLYMYFTYNW